MTPSSGDRRVVGVPLPALITPSDAVRGALRRLSPPLQYVTALGATALLRAVAIPARLHSGLGAYGEYQAYIDLRDVTIQVMEGCNGLGFLVTLVIGAMTIVNSRRMALMLLAAAIPLALGANALRVAILSVGVERWGVDFVRGPTLAHELAGWMTWSAALVALMGLAMLMARRHSGWDWARHRGHAPAGLRLQLTQYDERARWACMPPSASQDFIIRRRSRHASSDHA